MTSAINSEEAVASAEDPTSSTSASQTTNPITTNLSTEEDNTMVAEPTRTPPTSPHRGRNPFSNMRGLAMTNRKMTDVEQKNSDFLLKASERSPTRKNMTVVSPTPSSNGYPASSETSPVPPSSRVQRATAAAPVVGHHKKTGSLVGFDPLLDMGSISSPKEPTTPIGKQHKESVAKQPNLSSFGISPLTPPKEGTQKNLNSMAADLEGELTKLAYEVKAQSPQRNEDNGKSKIRKPKFGRASSLTPKFTLTPPLQFGNKSNNNAALKEPTSAPNRKMPWQRHRRSQSLEVPFADSTKKGQQGNQSVPQSGSMESPLSTTNTMMQDLYDVVKTQRDGLAIPSLAKPSPTSFLTGKEVVRSSELDPSPFQLEIPPLEQVVVNARASQFVELYRKEDLNLDLNMSLVGRRRLELQHFIALDKVPTNSNLIMAHKPVVESLLEVAEDATIAAYLESSSNAQSADTRREVVIFERQMQFIVVFRGSTPEQQGKTPFFKKNKAVALETLDPSDDTECKVYSSMKESYLDMERRVFAALDSLMDQNPFCDVIFTGHSWGGAMATVGAYRYALNRPVVRVSCQTFGSPKVGNRGFRQHTNSLPNLKVMRVEYASDTKCFVPSDGDHVGHSIVLGKDGQTNALAAVAYKFDDDHDARKHHHTKPIFAAWKKERDITSYVGSLEEMHQNKLKWVADFSGEDGTGVRGKDNEERQVV